MSEYVQINLSNILKTLGEDRTSSILSSFSCPKNEDVQEFIRNKAIEFSKQDLSKTHLVYYVDEDEKRLVGYFTIKSKYIKISKKALSAKDKRRFNRHGTYDEELRKYIIPAILIGQLGKNYADGNDKYISGDELLSMALQKISYIQSEAGGKFIYLECEDKEKLLNFYKKNGFREYGKRMLDGDETGLHGSYLIQLLKYV